ncbi:tegument protein VP13/14 [Saimiriine alphaherpesvirus 1]|uniref:Tegument protein UL47 n=1 Tax=Saimiriine herpesvirus 1 (strain MV-5-4-PSL) TaxID=10353 RepID=E2IUC3_SHV1|nr:tegument protein VP13/14 [Saimiriine alphaherpesvirus 1]ADO13781.1 tegument protein VP13/14 [Saimiriine alphaherpesvirus 1]
MPLSEGRGTRGSSSRVRAASVDGGDGGLVGFLWSVFWRSGDSADSIASGELSDADSPPSRAFDAPRGAQSPMRGRRARRPHDVHRERDEPCLLWRLELEREPPDETLPESHTLELYDGVASAEPTGSRHRATVSDAQRVFPTWLFRPMADPWLEPAASTNAFGQPVLLFSAPMWRSFATAPAGRMFFASPLQASEMWCRSLRQGRGLAWALTGASLHTSLGQTRATVALGLSFLTDALLRVAANVRRAGAYVHASHGGDSAGEGGRRSLSEASRLRYAAASALRPIPSSAAPLLTEYTEPAPGGPLAASLRGSLGSMGHWSDLRALLDGGLRAAVRHACRVSFVAEAVMLARASPDAPRSLLSREVAALGRIADVLAVLSETALQWVGAAVSARLHPDRWHRAYDEVECSRLFRALPLGSARVADAEFEALGDQGARRLTRASALGTALAAAAYSLRSALGYVMWRFARVAEGSSGPRGEAPRVPLGEERCWRSDRGEGGGGFRSREREYGWSGSDDADDDASGHDYDGEESEDGAASARALIAAALIIQRLLGLLNSVAACLALAAEDGSAPTAAATGDLLPPRYACVMLMARPLYNCASYAQFWSDARDAMANLRIQAAARAPPPDQSAVVTLGFLREAIEAFPAAPAGGLPKRSVLGPRVPLRDDASRFRRLVMREPARTSSGGLPAPESFMEGTTETM